jgi:succinate dehydrogenase / fumarate reductase cytochrome b subunit
MMAVSFHLHHGFQSAFQTLGLNHVKYTPAIKAFGAVFAYVIPAVFAFIPVYVFLFMKG